MMRRFSLLAAVVALGLALGGCTTAGGGMAGTGTESSLAIGDASGKPGDVVSVPVTVTNGGQVESVTFTVRVENPHTATPVSATVGSAMAGAAAQVERNEETGEITVSLERSLAFPPGSAEVALIQFQLSLDIQPGDCTRLLIVRSRIAHDGGTVSTSHSAQAGRLCAD